MIEQRRDRNNFSKEKYVNNVIKRITFACAILGLSNIYKCPIQKVFRIRCPGCGMTRAILAAIKMNFQEAFQYHNLFPIVILATIYLMFREKISIGKKNEEIAMGFFLIIFILRWCICIVI